MSPESLSWYFEFEIMDLAVARLHAALVH
uniref:Uncharacterized protein n=1 Tax=Rhizophora mucronata TaxID=61149 RepID=A0A2P2P8P6_RHIMU